MVILHAFATSALNFLFPFSLQPLFCLEFLFTRDSFQVKDDSALHLSLAHLLEYLCQIFHLLNSQPSLDYPSSCHIQDLEDRGVSNCLLRVVLRTSRPIWMSWQGLDKREDLWVTRFSLPLLPLFGCLQRFL